MKVGLESLKNGDVLLSDVANLNGTVISKAGTVLDEVVLRRFKIWSIKEVEIKSEIAEYSNKDIGPNCDSAVTGINPIMDKILNIAEKIKSQRINDLVAK